MPAVEPVAVSPPTANRRQLVMAAWIAAVGVLVLVRGLPLERAQVLTICVTGLLAASVGSPGRAARAVRDWGPIALALSGYDLLRGLADELGRPVQVAAPAMADELLFGTVPTVWLQERIPASATWWSIAVSLLYASHFVAPFAVAAVVWRRSRAAWVRWRRRFLTVTAVALACFLAAPVAPPWVAAGVGEIGPVARIAERGWSTIGLDIAADVIDYGQASTNLYAAMPSLHAAYALITALVLWPVLTRPAAVMAMLYPGAVGFVLVATGEHYVVDVLAGFALVVGVSVAWTRGERRRDAHSRPIVWRPVDRRFAWLAPIVTTAALAAVVRGIRLERPRVFVYDEVFYVNDALDLALLGSQPAAFHPPFAKLVVAPFIGIFGVEPFVWRLPILICGTATVAMVGTAVWLATRDRRMTALAGLLAATDGILVVTGRIALLDGVAALCSAAMLAGLLGVHGQGGWAATGHRRWAAVVAFGAAAAGVATKWALAPAALVTVVALLAPVGRRWRLPQPACAGILTGGLLLATTVAWGPAVVVPGTGIPQVSPFAAMVHDSVEMTSYHLSLDRSGGGHASGWTWFAQTSPTVLYEFPCGDVRDLADGVCVPWSSAPATIVARGNPVLWVAGTVAVGLLAVRSPRAAPAILTVSIAAATWIPWLLPGTRPYSFYGAAVAPVLAIAVALVLARWRHRVAASLVVGALASVWLVVAYPSLAAIS
ncbi:MAG: phosphatase PAP2 family protein [Acidimicrobiales bacterium]